MSPSSTLSQPMPLSASAEHAKRQASARRQRLPSLTGLAVALLFLGAAVLLWHDRRLALHEGEAAAGREAARVARDIEQSLTLARNIIDQTQASGPSSSATDTPGGSAIQAAQARAELLSALPLPFSLEELDRSGRPTPLVRDLSGSKLGTTATMPPRLPDQMAPDRWTAGLPEGPRDARRIPFFWPAPANGRGVQAYRADIALAPLLARLEVDRQDPGGGVALFRLDPSGGLTLLARAPFDEAHVGQALPEPLAQRLHASERGSFATIGSLDGVARRTAFHRLSAPADHLVVAFGLSERALLAPWRARLPYWMTLSGLLAALLVYGGRRLERSLRALAESEQRFRLAAASGHVWDWNGQTRALQLPSVIWSNLGLDLPMPDQTVAAFTDRLHPQDHDRVKALFLQHLQQRKPFHAVFRLRDASGSYRWFETEGQAAWNAQGQATFMAGTAFEITERRSLEEAQRQTLHRLDMVANASPALFWTADQDMRYEWVNRRWLRFTGRAPEDALGHRWTEGIHDEDQARYLAICQHAYATRKPFSAEFRRLHHDGSYRWMLDQGMPRHDADGNFIGFIGASMDIHEQKSLEQERERLSAFVVLLLRLASRFINMPLARIDAEIDEALGEIGRFVGADRAYVFIYDFPAHTGSNTHEWCAPGIPAQKDQLQNLTLDLIPDWVSTHLRGDTLHVHDTLQLPPGALRDILEPQGIRSLITLPLRGQDACYGFVGFDAVTDTHTYDDEEKNLLQLFGQVLVNVQERQLSETRLSRFASELEARVQERTEQLDASVKHLSRANAELETFTYSVSHDLKTPLRSLEGFSSLLLEEHAAALPADAQAHLQRIQRSARHMSRLIQDLLDYSRLDKSQQVLQSLNLAHTVNQALAQQHDALQERGAQVEVHVASRLVVRASSEGMAMVLRNLIDNALKFTRAGELPRLQISAEDLGQRVRLTVADQGQGFDMKHHDRIFALFQRLHRPDQVAGTGIGLAMVHKAIERMDGRIWAESEPGQGARFHIELHSG